VNVWTERLVAKWPVGLWLLVGAMPALAQQAPPAPVAVRVAEQRLLAPITWYPGTVISRNQARLAAEVEGRLKSVAEVGTVIDAGDEVARLDDLLLRQELAVEKAAIARDRARLEYLDAEVGRLTKLVRQKTINESALDEAVSNRGVTRGELAASVARVALTEERLRRTVIHAPFSGVVTERVLQAGEWAESGAAVLRLVDTSSLEVQAWVPVKALNFVHPGSELELSGNPHKAPGRVRTIVPVGDNRSRLYEVRLGLEPGTWPVGADLRVAIPTAEAREVIAIPRDALVIRRDATTVFRVNAEGLAERVSVNTGIAVGELIEVDGIAVGDKVITRGGERLRPGQNVTILDSGTRE
jgi:RND family efflux transporter MFP subunit